MFRLRAHCADRGKNALAFLRERLLKAPSDWLDSLGAPLSFVSCKFATSGAAAISGPLDSPLREFSMEVLREDRTALYFELVSKWTQVPGAGALPVDASSLRPFAARPSEYVKSEHEFLRERLAQLSKGLG